MKIAVFKKCMQRFKFKLKSLRMPYKKVVKPSHRKEMAIAYKKTQKLSTRLVCQAFSISETCFRYKALLCDENAEISDWLIKLTSTWCNWGFGLCFLYLRNVKGFK